MKIIIVGAGKVGLSIARHLSGEGNDIVLVDKDTEALEEIDSDLDVMSLKGNGLRTSVLLDAGIEDADLIIAATPSDEINMLCCLTGKRLGPQHTIARIRDPEYAMELTQLQKELGLNMVINPEREAAAEIVRVLRFPSAITVEPFFGGKAEMVAFRISENGPLQGQTLFKLMARVQKAVVFCAIERNGECIIPDGNLVFQPGDIAYAIGKPSEIASFFKGIGKFAARAASVLVIGGGRVAYYLTQTLLKMGVQVKIIEMNRNRCEDLCELLPKAIIIHGDGSDEKLLQSENIGGYDAVITATGRDEENLLTALYASRLGVPKVIAKINRIGYENIIKSFGIDSIISPKNLTAAQIIRYVRALKNTLGNNAETLYKIVGGKAEALEFIVGCNSKYLGKPLRDVPFRRNCLAAAIERNGTIIIPSGSDAFELGDRLVVVSTDAHFMDLNDAFENGGRAK